MDHSGQGGRLNESLSAVISVDGWINRGQSGWMDQMRSLWMFGLLYSVHGGWLDGFSGCIVGTKVDIVNDWIIAVRMDGCINGFAK